MEEHRPDPDKLLQRAHEEERRDKKGASKFIWVQRLASVKHTKCP